MKIKKSKYLFFHHRKYPKIDLNKIFDASVKNELNLENQILAIPILYGQEVIVSSEEFNFITGLSEHEWSEFDNLEEIKKLLDYGIVLCDSDNEVYVKYCKREKALNDNKWHIYSAMFNFMTKWKGIDVKLKEEYHDVVSENRIDQLKDFYGMPPNHFHQVDDYENKQKKKLHVTEYDNDFFNTLKKRKTTRVFEKKEKLSFDKFSTMLYYSFGVQGVNNSYKEIPVLKKTSPSGGSLHPTEVFVFVLNVENLATGFYHYYTKKNELVLLKEYSLEEAKMKAYHFTAGQEYTSNACFLTFLSTRYYRNFWKYMKHTKAYSVTIRDAAHLCQTFYLVDSYLNLGTFTAAINQGDVEDELGLDPYEHGVTMMVGCGIEKKGDYLSSLKPIYNKYEFD